MNISYFRLKNYKWRQYLRQKRFSKRRVSFLRNLQLSPQYSFLRDILILVWSYCFLRTDKFMAISLLSSPLWSYNIKKTTYSLLSSLLSSSISNTELSPCLIFLLELQNSSCHYFYMGFLCILYPFYHLYYSKRYWGHFIQCIHIMNSKNIYRLN